jgi:hypothetical protein
LMSGLVSSTWSPYQAAGVGDIFLEAVVLLSAGSVKHLCRFRLQVMNENL